VHSALRGVSKLVGSRPNSHLLRDTSETAAHAED
jgi:hypothetical protein